MKFDELFPNTPSLAQHEFKGSFIVKGTELEECWHCGEPTLWVDGCFEAPLCSEECDLAKWDEYFAATNS